MQAEVPQPALGAIAQMEMLLTQLPPDQGAVGKLLLSISQTQFQQAQHQLQLSQKKRLRNLLGSYQSWHMMEAL